MFEDCDSPELCVLSVLVDVSVDDDSVDDESVDVDESVLDESVDVDESVLEESVELSELESLDWYLVMSML